jgi:ATP-dependent protease ClpP protease subunit
MHRGGGRSRWAAGMVLASLLAAWPARAEPPIRSAAGPEARRLTPGTLRVVSPPSAAGTVFLSWEGSIAPPMAEQIGQAFDAFRTSRRRVVLALNTGGGSVSEGERVIQVLRRIRNTHQLDTTVGPGARCGSMCLPIYLQGHNRFGARASTWLFHEITRPGTQYGRQKRVEGSYKRLIENYWAPAGVSKAWIDQMLAQTDNHDWWQTGHDLIVAKSGIITRPIENRRSRNLEIDADTKPDGARPGTPVAGPAEAAKRTPVELPRSTPFPPPLTSSQQPNASAGPVQQGPAGEPAEPPRDRGPGTE